LLCGDSKMPKPVPGRISIPITMTIEPELLSVIDESAKKLGMSRSEFVTTFLEITLESQTPVINFAAALGSAYRKLWPRYKVSAKDFKTA
jgi:hypothetical protein